MQETAPSPPEAPRLTLVETARLATAALRTATTNERRKATQGHRSTRVGGWRHLTGPSRVLPDAVIVGAQRAGTSSLFEGIVAHPDVEPPIRKEVHYFDRFWGRGEYWYRGHFPTERRMSRRAARRGRRPITLEGTPMYLFRPVATKRLARTLPAARLIAVLRDPVARAYSQYRLVRHRDAERPWTFDEAYRRDPVWSAASPASFMRDAAFPRAYRFLTPPLLARGLYAYQLERLFALVPREQVLVLAAEQMYRDETAFFRCVYEFLGLDVIEPVFERVRPPRAHPMLPESRATLQAFFAPHNERLFELLGVDFGVEPDPAVTDRIDPWRRLLGDECRQLREAAASVDDFDVRAVARLRRTWPAELVAIAIELVEARRRAGRKFPDEAPRLVADRAGVEQATSRLVADHKARRFAGRGVRPAADLCCGIGGDAMSLARLAPDLVAVDREPLRAWMAGRNAGCRTLVADVETVDPPDGAFHLDPARRDERTGRRVRRFDDYRPGPAALGRLLEACPDGAVKLGPGIDFATLPPGPHEIELISEHRGLVQAVLWTGRLAAHPGLRSATRLPEGTCFVGAPAPVPAGVCAGIGAWLFTVDPAIERAGLLEPLRAGLGLAALHPRAGVLTSDGACTDPWLEPFRVVTELSLRAAEVRRWLRRNDGGIVEVRARGVDIDVDRWQRELRGDGTTSYALFALRLGERRCVAVAQRPTG